MSRNSIAMQLKGGAMYCPLKRDVTASTRLARLGNVLLRSRKDFGEVDAERLRHAQNSFQRRDPLALLHITDGLLRQSRGLRHGVLRQTTAFSLLFEKTSNLLALGLTGLVQCLASLSKTRLTSLVPSC